MWQYEFRVGKKSFVEAPDLRVVRRKLLKVLLVENLICLIRRRDANYFSANYHERNFNYSKKFRFVATQRSLLDKERLLRRLYYLKFPLP